MGTSTIFKRHNDFGSRLAGMSKEELEKLDKVSPWAGEQNLPYGWTAPLELHNSDIHILLWWKGMLIRLENAPEQEILHRKFWNRYKGKTENRSEWSIIKIALRYRIEEAERNYRKKHRELRKTQTKTEKSTSLDI